MGKEPGVNPGLCRNRIAGKLAISNDPEQEKNMTNLEVARTFISNWRSQNEIRLSAELTSFSNETHRKPDSYLFEIAENGLIDPETKRPVREFIDKESYLGRVEFQIFETLEKWSQRNEEGLAVWVSPPYPGRYPCSKIIISKIAYEWSLQKKFLLNSAILFDLNSRDTTHLASEITPQKFRDPEKVRGALFVFADSNEVELKILDLVKKYSPQTSHKFSYPIPKGAQVFVDMIKGGVASDIIIHEMKRSGFLGSHAVSCSFSTQTTSQSPTYSEFAVSRSNVVNLSESAKFVKRCGNCGKEINSFISRGYRCSNCGGVYEGC